MSISRSITQSVLRRAPQPAPEEPATDGPPPVDGTRVPAYLLAMSRSARRRGAETGRAARDLATDGLRVVTSPTVLAGVAAESAWVAAHVLTYPAGLLGDREREGRDGYRIEHLPPSRRGLLVSDVEAAGTPILLVHGPVDNRSVFTVMRRGLARRGFGHVMTMNYSPLADDVRVIADRLGRHVERLVERTGYERVHIVGHSLGGLAARYCVTRLGGDERVHTVVTLGTPHEGSVLAYAWPGRLGRQLRPGSSLLRELAEPVPECRTRFVAYWSDLDQLVLPHRSAALTHPDLDVTNVALHAVGHLSLPVVGAVVHGIRRRSPISTPLVARSFRASRRSPGGSDARRAASPRAPSRVPAGLGLDPDRSSTGCVTGFASRKGHGRVRDQCQHRSASRSRRRHALCPLHTRSP